MSTEQEEMNAALGNILGDEPSDNPIDDPKDEVIEEEVVEEVIEDQPEEKPPGFKSYEDWVAEGGDPDKWQGKTKYTEHYNLIQDTKSLKAEVRAMNDLLKTTVEATTEMNKREYQRGIDAAKRDLDVAIESEDVNAVVEAKDKLAEVQRQQPKQSQPVVNPIHSEFFSANPVVDAESGQYNADINSEFQRIYNGKLRADGVKPDDVLEPATIKRYMNAALKSAKDLFPDVSESPRNKRAAAKSTIKRNVTKPNAGDSLKTIKVKTRNSKDTNAVMDVYEAIKAKDPKAAEAFAKRMQNQ